MLQITAYPGFLNPNSTTEEQERIFLEKLIYLASNNVIFFGSFNEFTWDKECYPYISLNDVFGWASADAESFKLIELDIILNIYENFGHEGINAWAAIKRTYEVLNQLQTQKYFEAKKYLSLQQNIKIKNFEVTIKEDLLILRKLFWLASHDLIYFVKQNEDNIGNFKLDDKYYIFSVFRKQFKKEYIDELIDLYTKFGVQGFNAWRAFEDKIWEPKEHIKNKEYYEVIDYLKQKYS